MTESPSPESAAGPNRVGLFGGTFDPPHLGHLIAADQVRCELELDAVWFVVANDPWQKDGTRAITPAEVRLAMTRAAVSGVDGLSVTDVELANGGPSYTIETLATLGRRHPSTSWLVVVGADAASRLSTWHRAEELRASAEFVVVNRPGSTGSAPSGWRSRPVEIPAIGVSSTDVRARVAAGRSVRFLVPDPVIDLLHEHGLYRRSA